MAQNSIEIIIAAKDLFSRTLRKATAKFQKFGAGLSSLGRQLTIGLTAPLALLGGSAIKAAVRFESAFAGVKKTVDATEKQFAALSLGIREMTKRLPNTAEEIAGVAEAAGQLGIQTENILSFTEVMIGLGTTTNVSAKEAATSLARLANITRLSSDDFGKLGSAIVDLGNNFATTEREIIDMSLNLAPVAIQVGFTTQDILAFSAAMSSVGVQAELAGSAMGRVLADIATAAKGGGRDLRNFADIAGVSAKDFSRAFQKDAAKATLSFIKGLDRLKNEGENVFEILEDLGFQNIRIRKTVLALAKANDLLSDSIDTSRKAFAENTALQEELNKRLATSGVQFAILGNRIKLVAIDLGEALLPFLKNLVEVFEPLIDKTKVLVEEFTKLPGQTQATIAKFTLLAAMLGPMAIAFGAIATAVGGAFSVVSVWGLAIAAASTLIIRFIGLNKIINIAIGVLEALALAWVFAWESIKETFRLGWVREHITEPLIESAVFLRDFVIKTWDSFLDKIEEVKKALPTAEDFMAPQTVSALDSMKAKFAEIRGTVKGLSDDFTKFTDKIVGVPKQFKGGGLTQRVPGRVPQVGAATGDDESGIARDKTNVLELSDVLDKLGEKLKEFKKNSQLTAEVVADSILLMVESISKGIGQAFAGVIVFGENLMDAMQLLLKQVVATIIASLIQILAERAIHNALAAILEQASAASSISAEAAKTFAAAFASVISALPFPANVIAAPIVATTTTAAMIAGSQGAKASGFASFAEGGVVSRPTLALVGDNVGGQEAIIPMKGGKVPVAMSGNSGGLTIGVVNILPNARLDETISNKPISWWRDLARDKILPALNNLGSRNATTSLRFKEATF